MQAAVRGHAARTSAAAAAAAAEEATEAPEEQGEAKAAAKPNLLERIVSFTKSMSFSKSSSPPEEAVKAAEPKVEEEEELEVQAEAGHPVDGALLLIPVPQLSLAWPPGASGPLGSGCATHSGRGTRPLRAK
eukprot:scaffold74579_cov33-Phaeocystis_antarctica.AAC.2